MRGSNKIVFLLLIFFSCNLKFSSQTESSERNTEPWNTAELDLARASSEISDIEKDVLLEINKARTDPAKYAELYIKPTLEHYDGNLYKGYLKTKEGAAVVGECIKVMSGAAKRSPLALDLKLVKLSKYHTAKQSITKETGHDSPHGKSFKKRFKRLIKKGLAVGENISYGNNTAREIIVQLLVDDGVSGRGHRKNILDKDYTDCGIACGTHEKYNYMCTIDFSGIPVRAKKK
jgi:uncharacterized protein YkwD